MQTLYPHALSWNSPSSVIVHRQKRYIAKTQVGFYQLSLFTVCICTVKGFVWFRVLMTKMRETETQICLEKRTVHERQAEYAGCLWMHLYTFLHWKWIYSHMYRGVGLCLLLQEEGTSFSIHCTLLALMHTWQVHMCIYRYIQYIHSYIQYIQDRWENSRRLEGLETKGLSGS